MTFIQYAESKNVHLLNDDIKWLKKITKGHSKQKIRPLMRLYIDVWCDGRDSCDNAIKSQNAGRKAANQWLIGELNGRDGDLV